MTAAKIMDIISRLPGCDGQAADAVSAYTQVKMEDAPKLLKIPKSECPRHLDSSTTSQMAKIMVQYGRPIRSSWAKSVRSSFGRAVMGKANWENPIEVRLGEGFQLRLLIRTHREKGLFLSVYVDDIKLAGKKQNIDPVWKVLNKEVDLGEPTSFLIMYTWMHSKTMWNKQRLLLAITEPCLNRKFPREELKNFHALRIFVFLHGPMIWKVMPRNVWNDIVSWQTGRLNNSTKYLLHALMTIISKKKNWNPWENCQKYALKLFWNAYTWHVLEDPKIHGQRTNMRDQSLNGPKLVTNALNRFICNIHHTCEYKQYCHVWVIMQNNAGWDCFKTPDFAGDLEDSKSTSGGTLCVFGSHTFVPSKLMCKKQTQFHTVQ